MATSPPVPPHPHFPHREVLHVVRSHVRPGSFPLLLATAIVLYVLNGLAIGSDTGEVLEKLAYAAVACAGLYFLSVRRGPLLFGTVAVAIILMLNLGWGPPAPDARRMLDDFVGALFIAWLFSFVLREVFRRSNSERDAIVGALGGFLLLILAFTRADSFLEAWAPGSYAFNGLAPDRQSNAAMVAAFQYFSTITMTTVGYGDIVPLSVEARLLSGLQAIVGQLYLAVVIATLVGRAAQARQ
jgi:hypothetical protein